MDNIKCIECKNHLTHSQIKNKKKRCTICIASKRIEYLVSEEYRKSIFKKTWSDDIYFKYFIFLQNHKMGKESISKLLKKVSNFFCEAETCFSGPQHISTEWINNTLYKVDHRGKIKPSLERFLIDQGIVTKISKDEKCDDAIQLRIATIPENFRRLIEIYYNEKKFSRKRQIEENARKPISMKTIETDIGMFIRFLKWIFEHHSEVLSWDLLQEEHVHSYLLTLSNQQREVVRKDLNVLFRLAIRKKIITHIPITDSPAKEYPKSTEPLTIEEQKKLANTIRNNIFNEPLSCLLTSFCFYHGLTSSEVRSIKISHVNLDSKCIYINGRPPLYLTSEDLLILENYAEERSKIKNVDRKEFLFVTKAHSYEDTPVSKNFVMKNVKKFTGHTPKKLRISCLCVLSSMYGSQFLIEAFGISLTQAARYGKMEEFLIDEEVKSALI